MATAEERGTLQAQLLREELAAVRLQLAAECDRRAAAEERAADATSRELRDLHAQVLTTTRCPSACALLGYAAGSQQLQRYASCIRAV